MHHQLRQLPILPGGTSGGTVTPFYPVGASSTQTIPQLLSCANILCRKSAAAPSPILPNPLLPISRPNQSFRARRSEQDFMLPSYRHDHFNSCPAEALRALRALVLISSCVPAALPGPTRCGPAGLWVHQSSCLHHNINKVQHSSWHHQWCSSLRGVLWSICRGRSAAVMPRWGGPLSDSVESK